MYLCCSSLHTHNLQNTGTIPILFQVRTAAAEALVAIAQILDSEDVGKHVLTIVLCYAHDEDDQRRTTAVPVCFTQRIFRSVIVIAFPFKNFFGVRAFFIVFRASFLSTHSVWQ